MLEPANYHTNRYPLVWKKIQKMTQQKNQNKTIQQSETELTTYIKEDAYL